MRAFITFLFLVIPFFIGNSQTSIEFIYNQTGSRTSRKTSTINLKSTAADRSVAELSVKVPTDLISDDLGDFKVLIYPNPFESEINIAVVGKTDLSSITISVFDQSGRLVMTKKENADKILLDISHLIPGIYFMHFIHDGRNKKWTIIKE